MARDDSVYVQGIDVAGRGGAFNTLEDLEDEFGEERMRNNPISEVGIVGSGLEVAATGLRPVVEIVYAGFLGVPVTSSSTRWRRYGIYSVAN